MRKTKSALYDILEMLRIEVIAAELPTYDLSKYVGSYTPKEIKKVSEQIGKDFEDALVRTSGNIIKGILDTDSKKYAMYQILEALTLELLKAYTDPTKSTTKK